MERIFIFEYISGGGMNKEKLPISLFCEGFSMLRAIISDFKKLDFKISTCLDKRIIHLSNLLETDIVHAVELTDEYLSIFTQLVKDNDTCFIIAPEFSNILLNLNKIAEKANKKILSVNSPGIEIGTLKIMTHNFFINNNLKTPITSIIPEKLNYPDMEYIRIKFNEYVSPVIVKPNDGVGAESIFLIDSDKKLESIAEHKEFLFEKNREYILQEYIPGVNLSMIILNNDKSQILSINSQDFKKSKRGSDLEYIGGASPAIDSKKYYNIMEPILSKVDFSSIRGIFGIDFIMKGSTPYFIEINPRLTTSYIGLRNIALYNPIYYLSKSSGSTPKGLFKKSINHSFFRRLDLINKGPKSNANLQLSKMRELNQKHCEFIIPPISFNDENNIYSCFIATKESSLKKSKIRFSEILNQLENLNLKPKDYIIK